MYYDFRWQRNRQFGDKGAMNDMPINLQVQVAAFKHDQMFAKSAVMNVGRAVPLGTALLGYV